MTTLLGIDLGTSSVKAVLTDAQGQIVGVESAHGGVSPR